MPTMQEIWAAAAQGTFAEIDGVGNVVEQMIADYLELQRAHEAFLRKYGHIVQAKPLHAAPQVQSPQAHQQPMPPPPPHAGGPRPLSQQQLDDRYPLPPPTITPEEAAQLEQSVQAIAQRLRPVARSAR